MRRINQAAAGLFLLTITASGAALATCPNTMPLELLADCMVYENNSAGFPTSDHAYLDRYREWLKTQPPATVFPPDSAGLPIIK